MTSQKLRTVALRAATEKAREQAPKKIEASPIVKWAGGKTQLLDRLIPRLPAHFDRYHEPFSGGAALFFAVAPEQAFLRDTNEELVNVYRTVRDQVEPLVRSLRRYRYERDSFYRVRAQDPSTMTPVQRAARFIYLNRTCFNGLYRVNRKGQFNVPFGRYANPTICDAPKLRTASRALQSADIDVGDFEEVLDRSNRGDFVYFDPPYVPRNRTSNFTAYTANSFNDEDQARLAETFRALDRKGVKAMLSNSDTPLVHELYQGFHIEKLLASRNINSRASARGPVYEVVVRNYR